MAAALGGKQRADDAFWAGWPCLIVLLMAFLLGVCGGMAAAFFLDPGEEISAGLRQYCSGVSEEVPEVSFLGSFRDCIRWPLAVLVFGMSSFGVLGIPVLFVVRGFLLAFSVSVFGAVLGPCGIAVAAVLFFCVILFGLPVLFLLGYAGLCDARMQLPKAEPWAAKRHRPELWLISFGVLAVSAAIQQTVLPVVLHHVCAYFAV